MTLARDAIVWARAAERDALIDGDVVSDLGGFPNHHEAMVDKEIAPDRRAGMNVDRGQKTRKMVHRTRQKEQPRLEKTMRDPVVRERPHTRICENLKPRPGGRIARLN